MQQAAGNILQSLLSLCEQTKGSDTSSYISKMTQYLSVDHNSNTIIIYGCMHAGAMIDDFNNAGKVRPYVDRHTGWIPVSLQYM